MYLPSVIISLNNNNEVVEWSEQLRSVNFVWLGAAAIGFESDSAPAGEEGE